MRALSPSKRSCAGSKSLESVPALKIDDLTQLRHKVINDYQAVIACIFDESVRSSIPEVKEALSRVAECVHELASALRGTEPGYRQSDALSFDFGPDGL